MAFGTVRADALEGSTRRVEIDKIVAIDDSLASGESPVWDGSEWQGVVPVSSVGLVVPSGLEVSGSPITGSGSFTVAYASGFQAFTTGESTKLATIASGAQVNVPTNLTYSGDTRTINSSTGSGVVLPLATTSTAGLMAAADKVKTNAAVVSDPTGITGADAVTNIVSLSQAEYSAIASPSATTLYVITD